ncbi:MAG: hypothetical protein ACHQRM_10355 [Bacteroidia bacterium]
MNRKQTNPFFFFALFLFSVSLLACHAKKSMPAASTSVDYASQGYVKAKVILYDVDGCKWMLQLDDGRKLVPSPALDPKFTTEGLNVWVKFTMLKGSVSTCMAGENVTVVGIEKNP